MTTTLAAAIGKLKHMRPQFRRPGDLEDRINDLRTALDHTVEALEAIERRLVRIEQKLRGLR